MASAYGIFAEQGVRYGQPGLITVLRVEGLDHSVWLDQSNPQAQPVTTPQLAYLINNILSDESRALAQPRASKLIGDRTDRGHEIWTDIRWPGFVDDWLHAYTVGRRVDSHTCI